MSKLMGKHNDPFWIIVKGFISWLISIVVGDRLLWNNPKILNAIILVCVFALCFFILDRIHAKIYHIIKGDSKPVSTLTVPKPAPPKMQTSSEMQTPHQPKKPTDDELFENIVKRLGK